MHDDLKPTTVEKLIPMGKKLQVGVCDIFWYPLILLTHAQQSSYLQTSKMGATSSDPVDPRDISDLSSAPIRSAAYLAHFSANEVVYEQTIKVYGLVINRSGWFIVFMN